jgi:hypothetical protein
MGAMSYPIEQIQEFFDAADGWVVKQRSTISGEVWFGEAEFIGALWFDSGMWHTHNLYQPDNHGTADNIASVMGIHVGGGMQNFLSNRAKQALRVSIAKYLTRSMDAKIKK